MKKGNEKRNYEENETVELNIEDLTEIQGGIEDDRKITKENCGLGCYIGSGSGGPVDPKSL